MPTRSSILQAYWGKGGKSPWRRLHHVLSTGGWGAVATKLWAVWLYARHRPVPGKARTDRRDYGQWLRLFDVPTPQYRAALQARLAEMKKAPLISVLMPTYNPRREWLVDAIESVREQWYGNWQLCIADDASPQPHVREVLKHYALLDWRIRVHLRETNGHICASSNDALALAQGEWVALLDHDDVLPPHALAEMVLALDRHPAARLAYSDEDKLGPGGRFEPYFKSDWNPELFLSQNMFSHLGMLQTELVRGVGGFRPGLEGSQDYDLVLRCLERVDVSQVLHVPHVLYHWRVHEGSTAGSNEAKPYAQVAAVRALTEHLERTGRGGEIEVSWAGYRRRPPLPTPTPRVAVLLVGNAAERSLPAVRASVAGIGASVHVASCMDAGHVAAHADVVCLLTVPARPLVAGWLEELVRHACEPEVGLAAPMLQYAGGTIASAGVVLTPTGQGLDAQAGLPVGHAGHGGRTQLAQRLSAVRDACVVLRREVLEAVQPHLSSGDGGLRFSAAVRGLGLAVVWTPQARLRVRRGHLPPLGRLPGTGRVDPFYNPNLHQAEADFTYGWPPQRCADD